MTLVSPTPTAPFVPESLPSVSPNQKRPRTPPSTLHFRSSLDKGGVPAWQVHFLQLLKQVPTAKAVKCANPAGIVRLEPKSSRKASVESTTSCSTQVTNTKDAEPAKYHLKKHKPDFDRMRHRQLIESRIKSLRIGDLSIAENLEKLCNHYFKLDRTSSKEDSEFNRKLSQLFSKSEQDYCSQDDKQLRRHQSRTPKNSSVSFALPEIQPDSGSSGRKPSFTNMKSKADKSIDQETLPFKDIFHGYLSKKQVEKLLLMEGAFLVRNILHENGFILSFRFNGAIHNFRIFKDPQFHDLYLLEDRKNCYTSLNEMVNAGLQTLFLDLKAGSYIDILTEVAHIKKHDSMLWMLSPTPSPNYRKSSGLSIYVGKSGSRRPSENPQLQGFASGGQGQGQVATPTQVGRTSFLYVNPFQTQANFNSET